MIDPTFTPAQKAFRHEARAWLQACVPKDSLPSMDTKEGFGAHRAWERTLYEGRVGYGGRGPKCMAGAGLVLWSG